MNQKNLEANIESGFLLHKAGGVYNDLVIEPLGNKRYLWKKGENKGIADSVFDKENGWYIEIDDKIYFFESKPLDKVVFRVPDMDSIKSWVEGQKQSKKSDEIYRSIRKSIEVFLDLPFKHNYDIATLLVLESWASEKLNVVFYGSLVGGFGGGKTVTLEVLKGVSKHGILSGSITASGSSRIIEEQKLSVFYDELDVKDTTDDSSLYMSIRQGYRRNNKFIRLKSKTFEPEMFDSFGVKVFSLHSDIERATKTRAFTINIGETNDDRLSILNINKEILGKVHDEILFWYMDNITNAYIDIEAMPEVDLNSDTELIRNNLYNHAVSLFSAKEIEFLKMFRGRNIELGYIALQVCNIFGMNMLDSLKESFREKTEMESDFDESSLLAVAKETLEQYIDSDCIEQQKVFNEVNYTLENLNQNKVSTHKFKSILREFGFIDGVNKKKKEIDTAEGKKKSVNHLFFDERVKGKLSQLPQLARLSPFPNKDTTESSQFYWESEAIPKSRERVESKESKESKESTESLSNILVKIVGSAV